MNVSGSWWLLIDPNRPWWVVVTPVEPCRILVIDPKASTESIRIPEHQLFLLRLYTYLFSKITNKQTTNLKSPFSNSNQTPKRTTADKSKEEYMKSIAQEVRVYNKNGDEFQRVCIFC